MKTLRKSFICLVLSLTVLAAATPVAAQGFKWWQTERFQKDLGLTTEQVSRIEGIYQTTEPILRAQKKAVDKYEEKLSKAIADPKSDEPFVLQSIDRLEAARSDVSRTRNLLLFRIRRVLTDEQNLKLKTMHEHDRQERERRSKGPRGQDHNDHSDCQ